MIDRTARNTNSCSPGEKTDLCFCVTLGLAIKEQKQGLVDGKKVNITDEEIWIIQSCCCNYFKRNEIMNRPCV